MFGGLREWSLDDDSSEAEDDSPVASPQGNEHGNPFRHDASGSGMGLFAPEPVITIMDSHSGQPPNLPLAALPIGAPVWLCDAEDIFLLSKGFFDAAIVPFTYGNREFRVARHSGEQTYVVADEDPTLIVGFTVPRACLDNRPIRPRPVTFSAKSKPLQPAVGATLGPKPGRNLRMECSEAVFATRLGPFDEFCAGETACVLRTVAPVDAERVEQWYSMDESRLDSRIFHGMLPTALEKSSSHEAVVQAFAMSWRVGAQLAKHDPEKALPIALRILEEAPAAAVGYVRAAQAYLLLGKDETASELLRQASFLVRQQRNNMTTLQQWADTLRALVKEFIPRGLCLVIDNCFNRRLRAARTFRKGEVICEDQARFWCPSLMNCASLCVRCQRGLTDDEGVCFRAKGENQKCKSVAAEYRACSPECVEAANREFVSLETGGARQELYSAIYVIRERYPSVRDPSALETALLAIRGYTIVLNALRLGKPNRDMSSTLSALQDDFALVPPPYRPMDKKTVDDVMILYRILSSCLSPEEKALLSSDWFLKLFTACWCYRRTEGLGRVEGRETVVSLYLPTLAGCTSAKTMLRRKECGCPAGKVWELVALEDIDCGDRL